MERVITISLLIKTAQPLRQGGSGRRRQRTHRDSTRVRAPQGQTPQTQTSKPPNPENPKTQAPQTRNPNPQALGEAAAGGGARVRLEALQPRQLDGVLHLRGARWRTPCVCVCV